MSYHLQNFCDTKRERRADIFLAVMAMSISSQGNRCLSLTIGNVSGALPITHVTGMTVQDGGISEKERRGSPFKCDDILDYPV